MKGIYCYIDNENDEIVYVGKDSHIDTNERHKDHFQPSRYDAQPFNRILQNNPDRYEYRVLWSINDCSDNDLNNLEEYFIEKLNTYNYEHPDGFNFTRGGDGTSGYTHTEETKRKMSEERRGENNPMYGRTGEKSPTYGRKHTEEELKKMSETHKGKILSGEHRRKLSEKSKELWKDEEYRKKMRERDKKK